MFGILSCDMICVKQRGEEIRPDILKRKEVACTQNVICAATDASYRFLNKDNYNNINYKYRKNRKETETKTKQYK